MRYLVWLMMLVSCTEEPCIKTDYQQVQAFPEAGEVTVRWGYNKAMSDSKAVAQTQCYGVYCFIDIKGPPGNFNDSCSLQKLGHELGHAMGSQHE